MVIARLVANHFHVVHVEHEALSACRRIGPGDRGRQTFTSRDAGCRLRDPHGNLAAVHKTGHSHRHGRCSRCGSGAALLREERRRESCGQAGHRDVTECSMHPVLPENERGHETRVRSFSRSTPPAANASETPLRDRPCGGGLRGIHVLEQQHGANASRRLSCEVHFVGWRDHIE